jgi:hypothetical protein
MASRCVRCAGTGTVNAPVNGDIRTTTLVTCPVLWRYREHVDRSAARPGFIPAPALAGGRPC